MIQINGKSYAIKCDIYTLVQFCKRINEESITNAFKKLSSMGGENGITVDGIETWAAILFEMLKRGNKDLDLTIEDCHNTITDQKLIETAMAVITDSMPAAETIREGKETEAA